jgi:hypothetical protein
VDFRHEYEEAAGAEGIWRRDCATLTRRRMVRGARHDSPEFHFPVHTDEGSPHDSYLKCSNET